MPQVVVLAAISTAAEIGAGLVTGTITEVTLATVAQTFAKHLVISALTAALTKAKEPNLNQEARQLKQSIRSSVSPRRIVYGRARISGTLAYAGSSGDTNEYLHIVLPLHHGEFDALEESFLNDLPSTDARYTGFVRINVHSGTAAQVADSDLLLESPDWSASHRLRSIGYIYQRLKHDPTAFSAGIPNPSFVIRGRKVYDPRSGVTAWSNNPALCILDYLVGTVPTAAGADPIGIGASMAEIDLSSFIAAANLCDEQVPIKAGGTHSRYTCDGVVSLDGSPAAIMEQLLTSCAGVLVWSGGRYYLHPGAPTVATHTLTADMLRGAVQYKPYASRRESYNGVKGTYIDPLNAYEAADFPPQIDSTYLAEDGGEEKLLDLALPYTQDGVRAQRLARQFLERGRRSGALELQLNFSALGIAVWDCVTIDIAQLGLAGTKWRVKSWTFAEGGGIDLSLQEESDSAYVWSIANEVTPVAIPRPTIVRSNEVASPTGVAVSSASYISLEGAAIGGLLVEWTAAADAFVGGYEIEVSDHGLDDWMHGATVGRVTVASIPFLSVGTSYDVRIRSFRASGGATSPWVQVDDTTVQGDTSAPAAPSGVSASGVASAIKIDWTNPSDSDFRLARLYRHTANDSSLAAAVTDVFGLPGQGGTYTDPQTTGQTRYYWLKARDLSGNLSVFSSGVSATAG